MDLLVFSVARPPRRNLSVLYTSLHFWWKVEHLQTQRVIYFFTFWSSFGSILGSGRSQHSICLSTFDTRNEHVRETRKNTESLKQCPYWPPAGWRHFGSQKANPLKKTWFFCRKMGASHPKDTPDADSASGPVSTSRRRRDHAGLGDPNSLKILIWTQKRGLFGEPFEGDIISNS